jgi:fatty-acid desaturase
MSSDPALPTTSRYKRVSVLTSGVLIWFHIQAVAAFFAFTWTNLLIASMFYWMAAGLGISMGYHRLHTHRGFKTFKPFEYFLAICGTLTLEGGPIFWVATHRLL